MLANTSKQLEKLQKKGDEFTRKIVMEKKRQVDLESAIRHVRDEVEVYRNRSKKSAIDVMNLHILTPNPAFQKADGCEVAKQAEITQKKTLNVLETKVNKLNQRNSDLKVELESLVKQIDHMRKRNRQYVRSHRKSERVLAELRESIQVEFDQATAINEERERLIEERASLLEENKQEQGEFVEEYEELGFRVSQQNRLMEEAIFQERKKNVKGRDDGIDFHRGSLTMDEEIRMANRLEHITELLLSKTKSLASIEDRIAAYREVFGRLARLAGVETVEEAIDVFLKQEEDRFSLYNYVQSLSAEINSVRDQTRKLREELQTEREDQEVTNQERVGRLKQLEDEYRQEQEELSLLKASVEDYQSDLNRVGKKIQAVFFKLQCDQMDAKNTASNPSNGQTGGITTGTSGSSASSNRGGVLEESKASLLTGQSVTEANMVDFMGVIEQRAVGLLTSWNRSCNVTGTFSSPTRHALASPSSPNPRYTSQAPPFSSSSPVLFPSSSSSLAPLPIADDTILSSVEGFGVNEDTIVDLGEFKKSLEMTFDKH